jgi:hypothetical protein
MLVATHQNASTWYLFVGDRGIIDSLLNKPMIRIPEQKFTAIWFKNAHAIQLLAMTFVASQKGWDGVCLLVLLAISAIIKLSFRNTLITRMFCEANRVAIKSESFEFSGRTAMLGAIQKISESKAWAWMDEILSPCPRREVWAKDLSGTHTDADSNHFEVEMSSLSEFDRGWVLVNKSLADRAYTMMVNAVKGIVIEAV